MKHISKILKFLIILQVVLGVAACGKMSDPKPTEGSGYPHMYPKI